MTPARRSLPNDALLVVVDCFGVFLVSVFFLAGRNVLEWALGFGFFFGMCAYPAAVLTAAACRRPNDRSWMSAPVRHTRWALLTVAVGTATLFGGGLIRVLGDWAREYFRPFGKRVRRFFRLE